MYIEDPITLLIILGSLWGAWAWLLSGQDTSKSGTPRGT